MYFPDTKRGSKAHMERRHSNQGAAYNGQTKEYRTTLAL